MEDQARKIRSRGLFWLALTTMVAYLVYLLAPVITPFAIAALIAYVSDPLVDWLEDLHIRSWRLGRTLAVTLVFIMLTTLLVVSVLIMVPILIRQFRELVAYVPELVDWVTGQALPGLTAWLGLEQTDLDASAVTEWIKDYWRELTSAALDVAGTLGRGGKAMVTMAANLALIPVVGFYLMRDWDKIIQGAQNLLPRNVVANVSDLVSEIDETLSAFIRGQMMVMVALGLIYATGLSLVGLNMAFLIGLIAGLLSIVPYLGTAVGIAVAVAVALFQFGDVMHVLLVCIVFTVGQMSESMFLTPKLVGDRVGLHPVVVIFAVLAGGQLFGFLGVLLALPVTAALNVVVRHAQELYQSSWLYRD
jgi:predicted PurR-regulated permease PerM